MCGDPPPAEPIAERSRAFNHQSELGDYLGPFLDEFALDTPRRAGTQLDRLEAFHGQAVRAAGDGDSPTMVGRVTTASGVARRARPTAAR